MEPPWGQRNGATAGVVVRVSNFPWIGYPPPFWRVSMSNRRFENQHFRCLRRFQIQQIRATLPLRRDLSLQSSLLSRRSPCKLAQSRRQYRVSFGAMAPRSGRIVLIRKCVTRVVCVRTTEFPGQMTGRLRLTKARHRYIHANTDTVWRPLECTIAANSSPWLRSAF